MSAQETPSPTKDETTTRPDAADASAPANGKTNDAPVPLLKDDFPKGWKHVCSKEGCALEDIWRRAESSDNGPILVCTGEPKGLIFTEFEKDNFELTLEWRYPSDEKGNSGVLVFVQPSQQLWPDSIQIQLHQPEAGSIFPSGNGESANTSEARDLALPVGEWNTCRIVSIDGSLTVEINGKPAGKVSGCKPAKGAIGFQSEGAEIHFRKMMLKTLPASGTKATEPATVTEDSASVPEAAPKTVKQPNTE